MSSEPRSAEKQIKEFLDSDGFALWVRGEADTGYLQGLLETELQQYTTQECVALRERSNQNALDHAKTVDERNALQQRVEALGKAADLVLACRHGDETLCGCRRALATLRGVGTG